MCKWRIGCVLTLMIMAGSLAVAGEIHPDLAAVIATKDARDTVSAKLYLADHVDIASLSRMLDAEKATLQERHAVIVRALQEKAQATQGPLLAELARLQAAGQVKSYRAFWIDNVIVVDAAADQLLKLAEHPSVATAYLNYPITLDQPTAIRPDDGGSPMRTPEQGLVAIRAPEVWAMGIDGTGVLVANMDTGVAGTHPALASRWAGLLPEYAGHPQWAWHDALANPPSTFPSDSHGHGTHTMGTVCGGAPGDQVGVAPGARWIADNSINQWVGTPFDADVMAGFQWFADPDGNPETNWDVPAVVSNSWGVTSSMGYPNCDSRYWSYLDACEAVGCVVLFSAGNEGPSPNTLRRPSDRATDAYRTCAIAAVDGNNPNWPIASFSSRGPTNCTPNGQTAVKPEISAPGVGVRSAYPGGGYTYMDGTSMASPHVNGVVALMRQACPELTPDVIKQIIYDTCVDLGTPGKDNSYGWGMIDAVEAVIAAQDACGPRPPKVENQTLTTMVNTPATVSIVVDDDGEPNPPALTTVIIESLPAYGHLVDTATNTAILGAPYALAANGTQVTYYPNAYFSGADSFTFKANDYGVPPEGGDSESAQINITVNGVPSQAFGWMLDSDPGWTTEGAWAYGPSAGLGTHNGDPASAATGTFMYGYNLAGDYTNNMPARYLTTTAIDCARVTDVQIRFKRWLGVESHDTASVEVSNDGVNWTVVWTNNGNQYVDSAWVAQSHNVASVANNKPTFYVRWGMGPTDYSVTYPGWSIDDFEIWGLVSPPWLTGDVNCDGAVNFGDINPFVLRLSNPAVYWATFPACNELNADVDGDGMVSFSDINPFVALLSGI